VTRKLKSLCRSCVNAANAIVRGDFFGSSLQSQAVTLEALRAALGSLEALRQDTEALRQDTEALRQDTEALRQDTEALGLSVAGISAATHAAQASWLLGLNDQNEPEEALLCFLLPFLGEKTAIDVGAHRGRFTEALLNMGFARLWACEPHPQLSVALDQTYRNDARVDVLPLALSSQDGSAVLHLVSRSADEVESVDPLLFSALNPHSMPPGLEFSGETVPVEMRTIASLVAEQRLPAKAGLLKVDAEGYDLEVFKGMAASCCYDMLMSEFWSPDFVFATPGIPDQSEVGKYLSGAGYPFSISIVRKTDRSLAWVANMPVRLRQVWGNTLYFREAGLFQAALSFVSQMLPGPALHETR
jgi:FkbM family methyltransferase